MFVFKPIAENVLKGILQGNFVLRNNQRISSNELIRNVCPILGGDYPYMLNNKTYTPQGYYVYGSKSEPFDIVGFEAE